MRLRSFCPALLGWVPCAALGAGTDAVGLEPYLVSATRWERPAVPAAVSITVITAAEIRASGARHLVEVLRGRGGLATNDLFGDGSRATVSLRGFGANAQANTLVLVDGRRLNNTDLAPPDLNSISLKDVERIEIIRGGGGVLFGDQAVGGVVHVITRRPARLEAGVEAGYGSYERQLERAWVGGRLANGLSARASLERQLTDNYRDNNDLAYANGLARLGWEWGRGEAFLEFQRVEERLRLPGALFAAQLRSDRTQTRFPLDHSDTTTENARLGLSQALGPHWRLLAELTNRYADADSRLSDSPMTQKRHHREFTPRLVGSYPMRLGEAVLTLGTDLFATDYVLRSPFGQTDDEQSMRAVYAQALLSLAEGFDLVGGVRRAFVTDDLLDSFAFPLRTELDDEATAASLGVSVGLGQAARVFLRWERNFRFPLADEHTLTLPGVTLEAQRGDSYEAGLEWGWGPFTVNLLGYRLALDDEIDFDPTRNCFFGLCFGANVNLDPTLREGLIGEAEWLPVEHLRLSGQYSFVDARFEGGALAGNEIPAVAAHQLRLAAQYRQGEHLSLYGEVQAVGERHAQGDYENALAPLPGYAVVNLAVLYEQGGWTVSARLNNVLDKEYSDAAAVGYDPFPVRATGFYPAPERNFLLTLGYRFE